MPSKKLNTCMIESQSPSRLWPAWQSRRAQDRPRFEPAGGYEILKLQSEPLDAAGVGTFFPLGWFFEAAVPVSSGLTLVGQLSGQYRSVSAPSTSVVAPESQLLRLT
jgi:hypothetical protein